MPDTCPLMGKALGPAAFRLFSLSGMYQDMYHPMVGAIVKMKVLISENVSGGHQTL